jgi:hypothetical protein
LLRATRFVKSSTTDVVTSTDREPTVVVDDSV